MNNGYRNFDSLRCSLGFLSFVLCLVFSSSVFANPNNWSITDVRTTSTNAGGTTANTSIEFQRLMERPARLNLPIRVTGSQVAQVVRSGVRGTIRTGVWGGAILAGLEIYDIYRNDEGELEKRTPAETINEQEILQQDHLNHNCSPRGSREFGRCLSYDITPSQAISIWGWEGSVSECFCEKAVEYLMPFGDSCGKTLPSTFGWSSNFQTCTSPAHTCFDAEGNVMNYSGMNQKIIWCPNHPAHEHQQSEPATDEEIWEVIRNRFGPLLGDLLGDLLRARDPLSVQQQPDHPSQVHDIFRRFLEELDQRERNQRLIDDLLDDLTRRMTEGDSDHDILSDPNFEWPDIQTDPEMTPDRFLDLWRRIISGIPLTPEEQIEWDRFREQTDPLAIDPNRDSEGEPLLDEDGNPITDEDGNPLRMTPAPDITIEIPPIELDIPTDCDFMPTLCAWLEWFKTPADFPDIPDVEVDEQDIEWIDAGYSRPGGCPAPYSFQVFGSSYELSFEPACAFALLINPLILALAWLMAAYIVFREN